jgi:hypothetical protein
MYGFLIKMRIVVSDYQLFSKEKGPSGGRASLFCREIA